MAIGVNSITVDNSVAIGSASYADASDSSGISYLTGDPAGTYGVVSVGSANGSTIFQRRITNVAAGSEGTDAVNVNQLKAAQISVADLIGGTVSLNSNGTYSGITVTDHLGTSYTFSTVAAAMSAIAQGQINVVSAEGVTYSDGTKTNVQLSGTNGTTISNVANATSNDQAVNLGQMTNAIDASKVKYYSVNSSQTGNSGNIGASGTDAMAIGPAAVATGDRSISFGVGTEAEGTNSIVIGNANSSTDRVATASGESGIAIGTSASSTGTNSIAFGTYALTALQQTSTGNSVNSAIAIGDHAEATADQAVAIGKTAHASGVNSFAQGNTSSAIGTSSIAIGTNTNATGTASLALGMNSTTSGTNSGVIGTAMSTDSSQAGTTLNGSDTYVVGNGNGVVKGTNSSIIGNSNTVGTTVTDPAGIDHSYNTVNTSILGNSNIVTAQNVDVIGHGNTVGKKNLNAEGIEDGTIDTAAGSGVLGANNTVYGSGNKVIGNNNTDANLDSVFILGNNVTAGLANSAYIGSGSAYVGSGTTTAGASSYGSVTVGNGTYYFAGANAAGVVTVGAVGSERRIQNVSAGLITSGSTDAVNGSQLYTLTRPLRFAGDNSTVGDYSNASGIDQNVIQRSSDEAIKITGGASTSNLSSNNIGVVANTSNNTLTVQLAKDLTGLTSVTTGNTVMNTNGVTISTGGNTVSLTNNGLNNGGKTITNVAAGVNNTDAVNVSQLNTAAAAAKTTVSQGKNVTVTSSVNSTDGHTDYNVALNDAVTLGSGSTAVSINGTTGMITAGTGSNAVSLNGTNGTITSGLVTVNGSSGTVNGLTNKTWDPDDYVSGQAATEDQLKQVGTTLNSAGLNFVGNDGQSIHKDLGSTLNVVGGYTGTGSTSAGNIKTVKNTDGDLEIQMADDAVFNSVKTGNTILNSSGVTIGSGDTMVSLTDAGLNNGGNKITNVAAGTADTDGVNVSQLNQSAAAAKTTVSQGKNITVTETPEEDGHTDYNVALNDIITLGTGTSAVTIDGIAGTVATGNTTIYGDKIITGATTITDLGLITAGTGDYAVKIDGTAGTISAGTKVSFDGTQGTGTIGKVIINGSGTTGTVNGLTNKTWDPNNYTSGQAATEDQLSAATNNLINAGLTFAGNTGSIQKKLGDTMNIVGGYNGSGTTSGNNIKTVVNSNGDMEIQMADDASFNSVTTGNTVMNTNGVTTADTNGNTTSVTGSGVTTTDTAGHTTSVTAEGVTAADADGNSSALSSTGLTTTDAAGNTTSVTGNGMTITGENGKNVSLTSNGLDNGGNKITNVAAGTADTDAVNVSQLNAAAAAAKTTVSQGKNITVTSVQKDDGHTDYNVALNDTITLGSGTNAVTVDGTTGAVTTGNTAIYGDKIVTGATTITDQGVITAGTGDNAVKIDGTAGTIGAGTKVSFDGTQGTGTIGNVTINGNGSTGTVNGLTNKTWEPDNYVSGQAASEDQLKVLDDRTVQYDRNEDGTVNKGQITLAGDGGTKITNVTAGTLSSDSTDAVNGSQLYATNQAVINNSQSINILGNSINKLDNRVNKVGAGAAALAALHPLDFDPDNKWDFAAGFGNYRDATAVAVGAFYRPNEDTMFSVGGNFGNGENMVNAGVSFKLGQGNHVSTSRVAMAKELKDVRAVVAQQAEQIQQLAAMVNSLVGVQAVKPDTTVMFPDVPKNHWAYETIKAMAAQGLIEGYPDGTFGGDRTMTRYEFAQIIYRVMQKGIAVDSKLIGEFKPELERIRVDTIARDKNGNPTIERVRVNK